MINPNQLPNYFHQLVDASSAITQIKFSKQIPFEATSVKVGNYSCYWLYFPDADAYVPPFYIDYTLILKHTTTIQYWNLSAPYDAQNKLGPQPFNSPSYFFILEWSDDPRVTFAQGVAVNQTGILFPQAAFTQLTLTTVITVPTNVPIACPPTPMKGRQALMLQAHPTNTDIVYVGGFGVTADSTSTGGIQMAAGQSLPIDSADTDVDYAIAAIGGQQLIIIEAK